MCLPINVEKTTKGNVALSKTKEDGHTEKVLIRSWAVESVTKALKNVVNLGASSTRVGRYVVRACTGSKFVTVKDNKEGKTIFIEYASLGKAISSL
jgi:hypothetical protein